MLNQTYNNIEIILVDDGSKDCSAVLCDRYAKTDSRVRVIHQTNKGLAGARNSGIRIARGDYFSFIDAGDYVELNLYKLLIPYVNDGIDLIDFPFFSQISEHERFPAICSIEKNRVFNRDFIERDMMPCLLNIEDNPVINNPPICFVWKYLFKSSIVKKNNLLFDERRRKWEDKGFVVKYVDCSNTIVFYDKPLYSYICFGNEDHLSASYFRDLVFLIIEQREEYIKKYGGMYSFETDYYIRNSISNLMARIEEIVYNENEEVAKELINEIYTKRFVQKISEWKFTDDDKMSQYQQLIKNNDIDGTYLLMQQQIEDKNKAHAQENKARFFSRFKRKVKSIIRPLYYKVKPGKKA